MKNIVLFFLIASFLSCDRGYYNALQNEYNYEEAYNLAQGLKDGILIIQIPTDRRKLALLESMHEKETDLAKKALSKENLTNARDKLESVQYDMIAATLEYYKFSDFAFVPDSLIKEFKEGQRENIFLEYDLTLGKKVDIDDSKTIMFLRQHRDYDHLFVHQYDGTYPPAPFPYTSQLALKNTDEVAFDKLVSIKNEYIYHAIYIVDRKLTSFLGKYKNPNS